MPRQVGDAFVSHDSRWKNSLLVAATIALALVLAATAVFALFQIVLALLELWFS